ncbi:hypothetical protein ACL9RL_11560, partial [Plantibacter sp. Mn2098]|uniref:hypothetical protein n=1 Tax=Plantibacter sp. Mn2098 TaxID=3395266 RepID=UPI003BD5FA53
MTHLVGSIIVVDLLPCGCLLLNSEYHSTVRHRVGRTVSLVLFDVYSYDLLNAKWPPKNSWVAISTKKSGGVLLS